MASHAARYRGVAGRGGGGVSNIAMYDPQSGADVKGLGGMANIDRNIRLIS